MNLHTGGRSTILLLIATSTIAVTAAFVAVLPSPPLVSPRSLKVGFVVTSSKSSISTSSLHLFGNGGGNIPKSASDRDNQAINSIKAAISKPKKSSYPLIECEFPPLANQNKLGDGSLRSANQVDSANVAFCAKLIKSIAIPIIGPKVYLLLSSTVSNSFTKKIEAAVKGTSATIVPLRNGIPDKIGSKDVCVLLTPSGRNDYKAAEELAESKIKVVLINGFAKDTSSVSGDATMAYYLKPLTYNSQIAGYVIRSYPNKWTVVSNNKTLKTFDDKEMLFGDTNTPDLRASGFIVQKDVDQRAIKARS